MQGSDGYFYGTTDNGGTNNAGTVFQISTNGALTALYAFGTVTNASGVVALDGANPDAALVQGSDGNFYGTTQYGGTNGCGTVFRISPTGALTSLYSFTGGNDGGYGRFSGPTAGLVQGSDGSFYDTTFYGGTNGYGTVFQISPNGALSSLYSFPGGNEGAYPAAGLVQGSDGSFYGTTEYNGNHPAPQGGSFFGAGTVFKISPKGALSSLYSFTGGNDGANPVAGLVQGSDGSFYGTTVSGGQGGVGTVFRLTIVPDPQLTIIPSGSNMILTWPTNYLSFDYTGYILQSTTNLASPAVWTSVSPSPVVIGGQNVVVGPISVTQQFFRLSQ